MMALEKYKICPVCGEHNIPSLLECKKCEADLTGIKVVDDSINQDPLPNCSSQECINVSAGPSQMVRICECGAHNQPQARKCKECGEDISDIIPSEVCIDNRFSYKLVSLSEDYTASFEKPVVVIGREAEMSDYLGNKMYVSRQHAKLTIVADKVFIENLSKTNKTYINNKQIDDCTPVSINDGDEIGLGGMEINGNRQKDAAYFRFRIGL